LPIRHPSGDGPETTAAMTEFGLAFNGALPPDLVDVIERQVRPTGRQPAARRADVAAEGRALPHHRLDGNGDAGLGRNDRGGLERSGIGAGQQSVDPLTPQLLGPPFRLAGPPALHAGGPATSARAGGGE